MTPDTEALRAAIEHFESFGRYRNAADDQALYALRLVLAAQSASSDVEAVRAKIRSLWPEIASVSTLGEDLADKIARATLTACRLRSPVEAGGVTEDGWQLVPKRPTKEMLERGRSPFMAAFDPMFNKNEPCGPIYKAMLEAAPSLASAKLKEVDRG